jgi:hypothetical protein
MKHTRIQVVVGRDITLEEIILNRYTHRPHLVHSKCTNYMHKHIETHFM